MNLRKVASYNVGLDIGTGSVGWAAVDESGDICRFKGKPTWGSRIFSTAETAAAARVYRGQRRRYDRRRQRLNLLQGLFAEEMEKIDPEFFVRLNQSRLHPEDRDETHRDYKWPLFNDSDFDERAYYDKFPTIYHLRKWLMETGEPADIRLIYLAFHNIVKHRGNFLHQDNPSLSARNANMDEAVESLCAAFENWCSENDIECDCSPHEMLKALGDASMRTGDKRDAIKDAFRVEKGSKEGKGLATEAAKAVLGYKADFSKVFFIEADDAKFALSDEDKVETFSCPDEGMEFFESMRAMYSAYVLMGILNGAPGDTISYCKVKDYERYGRDLALLKQLVRHYVPERYNEYFRGEFYMDAQGRQTGVYNPDKAQGYTKYNLGTSKLSYEDFMDDISKKLFKGIDMGCDERFARMMAAIEDGTFLRRLKTSDNGSIPYQLHLEEMNAIIDNQAKHHPLLAEQRDKLNRLVDFRIPYYVGPLTTKNAAQENGELRFAWSQRKPGMENAKIYPWNWEEIIDKDASAELFIRRMTGTCTYLQGEPVLPRQSLVYEMFCVLNELNGAKWTQDGDSWHRFDAADRVGIIDDLFKKRKSGVTYKAVEDWLEKKHGVNGERSTGGAYHVSGGQGEARFESKLSSYCEFCNLLGVDEISDADASMVEDVILWSTVFEDRDILKHKVKQVYGDRFDDAAIRRIANKRLTGWGRLSAKLLTGLKTAVDCGPQKMSIMDILLEGDPNNGKRLGRAMNLMEILHEETFDFAQQIDELNKARVASDFDLSDVVGSPALRRSVNQAIRIVDEIASIAGKPPVNIFIEVTRDEERKNKGKRTTRRFDAVREALGKLKKEYAQVYAEIGGYKNRFDDERIALYFMQCGKCMYSGRPLDINRLQDYQVDHIIPQSYVKDDSFENKVLVYSDENQRKLDSMLLDRAIIARMKDFWMHLHDAGLIGDKKYNNLLRERISDERMRGFINRQLVETSQVVKQVQQVLDARFGNTRVIPVKAGWSHQLRDECGFAKCREVNDFHHAHDAYIACQLGRFVQYRHADVFDNPLKMAAVVKRFIRNEADKFNRNRMMPGTSEFIVSSFISSGFDEETGEVFGDAWNATAEVERMRRCLNYKDCFISRMPEETSGAFWAETIYSPRGGKKTPTIEVKKGLSVSKYGGYSVGQLAYFVFYRCEGQGGESCYRFSGVPIPVAQRIRRGELSIGEYVGTLAASEGFRNASVLKGKVLKYSRISYDGDDFYIPALDVVYSSRQLALSGDFLKCAADLCDDKKSDSVLCEESLNSLYDELRDKALFLCSGFRNVHRVLVERGCEFLTLSVSDKRTLLKNLLNFYKGNTTRVDLTLIGGSKNAGKILNGFLTKQLPDIEFIDQSVTGMFERRYKLGL